MDDISLRPSHTSICHRDVEEGSGDGVGCDDRNVDAVIGDCDDGDETSPLLGGTGPIHDKPCMIMDGINNDTKPFCNCNTGDQTISFREILPGDRTRIQELFEEWFPVEYKEEFYDHLCSQRAMGEQRLYTQLATVPTGEGEGHKIIACLLGCKVSACKLNNASRVLLIPGYKAKSDDGSTLETQSDLDKPIDEIESCGDPNSNNTNDNENEDDESIRGTEVFYIMTLGVMEEYRKRGLASYLVERALQDQIAVVPETSNGDVPAKPNEPQSLEDDEDVCEEFEGTEIYQLNKRTAESRCETAYLHVIIQNQAAICFYENLGFKRLREIADYYTIDEEKHNCYLYAKFFDKESVIDREERAKGMYSYYCYYYQNYSRGLSKNPVVMVDFFLRTIIRVVTSIWSSVSYYWILGGREGGQNSVLAAAKNK